EDCSWAELGTVSGQWELDSINATQCGSGSRGRGLCRSLAETPDHDENGSDTRVPHSSAGTGGNTSGCNSSPCIQTQSDLYGDGSRGNLYTVLQPGTSGAHQHAGHSGAANPREQSTLYDHEPGDCDRTSYFSTTLLCPGSRLGARGKCAFLFHFISRP